MSFIFWQMSSQEFTNGSHGVWGLSLRSGVWGTDKWQIKWIPSSQFAFFPFHRSQRFFVWLALSWGTAATYHWSLTSSFIVAKLPTASPPGLPAMPRPLPRPMPPWCGRHRSPAHAQCESHSGKGEQWMSGVGQRACLDRSRAARTSSGPAQDPLVTLPVGLAMNMRFTCVHLDWASLLASLLALWCQCCQSWVHSWRSLISDKCCDAKVERPVSCVGRVWRSARLLCKALITTRNV